MKYLVIVAHPDDEVLGCGGSMAKWTNNGHEVNLLIMSEGITSRDKKRNVALRDSELTDLKKSTIDSAKIIGIKTIHFLKLPDNRMDSVDFLDVVKEIESFLEKIKPDIVLTHHTSDLNLDHQITHKAVITAVRPIPDQTVKYLLSFEIPSSTEWQSTTSKNHFIPNWFEDISETLDIKLLALNCYKSEMRKWPHARSLKSVKHLSKWRGASIGIKAAEAFMLIRAIN